MPISFAAVLQGLTVLVAGALCFASTPAKAQTAPSVSADKAAIIVTARRLEEPLQVVPISVTALDDDALHGMGAETLADVARAVPNLIVAPVGVLGAEQPAIRGIFSPAGSSTVGIYIDDVPIQIRSLGFAGNADIRTFDLVRVEVLRGPQGTLFGANSMGGTIRFITRQPDLHLSDVRTQAEIGFTKDGGISREINGAVGGPIVPGRLGFRAGAYYRLDAGYVDRIDRRSGALRGRNINDVSALALRAGLKGAVGETVELTPSLLYQKSRRDDYPLFESSLGPHRQSNLHRQPGEDEFFLPSFTAKAALGGAELTSVTAYLDRHDRQVTDYSLTFGELVLGGLVPGLVPEGGTRSLTRVTQRSFTHETRLSSALAEAPLRWVVGAFYRRSRLGLTQSVVEPGISDLVESFFGASVEAVFGAPLLPGGISYRGTERVRETQLAGFGEVSWRLADTLEATAGVRVTRSRLGLRVLSEGPYAGGSITQPDERTQSETPVTPRFGLAYRPTQDQLLYASVGKGFRVGGANPPVPAAPCAADLRAFGRDEAPVSFNSDSLWSYEVGAKSSWARRRLQLSLSLFHIDWDGIQQPVSLPNCGFSFVDNLGTARSRGFELEAEARPVPPLSLTAAVGYVDARFRSTVLGGAMPGGERAIIVERGDRVPYVPRWTTRLAGEYRAALPRSLEGFLAAEYQYSSRYRRAPSEAAVGYDPRVYRGDAYGNVLARAGMEGDGWTVSAFVDNLLDDRSILFSSADLVPATRAPLRQLTPRPRTIGLAGSLLF